MKLPFFLVENPSKLSFEIIAHGAQIRPVLRCLLDFHGIFGRRCICTATVSAHELEPINLVRAGCWPGPAAPSSGAAPNGPESQSLRKVRGLRTRQHASAAGSPESANAPSQYKRRPCAPSDENKLQIAGTSNYNLNKTTFHPRRVSELLCVECFGVAGPRGSL